MNQRLQYRIEIFDRDGRLVRRTRWKRSDSWVRNYYRIMRTAWASASTTNHLTGTGGDTRNAIPPASFGSTQDMMRLNSGTSSAFGMQVGSGNTAVAMDDFQLETQIASGTGSGQLVYNTQEFTAPASHGTGWAYHLSRSFSNQSGGNVSVFECGIVALYPYTSSLTDNFLIARDVFAEQVVADGQSIAIAYRIKVDV